MTMRIGRSEACADIHFDDITEHCEITLRDGRIYIKAIYSINRTGVNGIVLHPNIEAELCEYRAIRLACMVLLSRADTNKERTV